MQWGYRPNQKVYSNDEGTFVLKSVVPGKALIGVDKAGLPRHEQALEVPEGGETVTLVLQMLRTLPLRGRVVDETGAPVMGARVSLSAETSG